MLAILKNHPFAVDAFFERSTVLSFAFKKEALQHLIPECLELDTFNNEWAFVAMALVKTRDLRPAGFPKFFGRDFFLIGYRIFVRYQNTEGKRLRGLYIIQSETDKKQMEFFGNLFTHYRYTTTDIRQFEKNKITRIESNGSKFFIESDNSVENAELPAGSIFKDWSEARRFAGPLPFTFTYNKLKREVLIIEGVRENWQPKPLKITAYSIDFFQKLNLENPILANAFFIENIPYHWKKGKLEQWKS